ncbi:rhomboid family intramembrane serine protease [Maritimibacter dapengensis]
MFLSYSLLHSGPVHMIGNMLVLWVVGRILRLRLGVKGFFFVYLVSAVGGALLFGLLTSSPQPMVGASGALFGLVGTWQYWRWSGRRRARRSLRPVLQTIAVLVALNAVVWVLQGGLLAWETHLGGFVAGWLAAALIEWKRGGPLRRRHVA